MSKSLTKVRKEIRILGLDACNPKITIGAIVRGGLYLDGILTFQQNINSDELAREIAETKYFPELRVIMSHDPKHRLNSRTIQRITAMPLIEIPLSIRTKVRLAETKEDQSGQGWKGAALDPLILKKILALTRVTGHMPEPVRIAHLVAKLHVF